MSAELAKAAAGTGLSTHEAAYTLPMFETTTYDNPEILALHVRKKWDFRETSSAAAVIKAVCPDEWADILAFLTTFTLDPQQWLKKGGNRGDIAKVIDESFAQRGWCETRVDLHTEGILYAKAGHEVGRLPVVKQEGYLVDNFKGRVALDVEWNAKDGNLDRDLSAYRSWHEAGVISAAVLITQDRLKLKDLATTIWRDYQDTLAEDERTPALPIDLRTSTTTNLEKAELRIRRGVMGTCPLLVIAATDATWNGNAFTETPEERADRLLGLRRSRVGRGPEVASESLPLAEEP